LPPHQGHFLPSLCFIVFVGFGVSLVAPLCPSGAPIFLVVSSKVSTFFFLFSLCFDGGVCGLWNKVRICLSSLFSFFSLSFSSSSSFIRLSFSSVFIL